MKKKTQADHVAEEMAALQPQETTQKVVVPGIETLHQRPINEIAEVLANVLRSAPNIIRMEFVTGSHISLTTRSQ